MTLHIQSGEKERLFILAVDPQGLPVLGATVQCSIRRTSNDEWWDGTAFTSTYTALSTTEWDPTNLPGLYYYDFQTPSNLTDSALFYASSPSSTVRNDPWIEDLKIGGFMNNLGSNLSGLDTSETQSIIGGTVVPSLSVIRSQITAQQESVDAAQDSLAVLKSYDQKFQVILDSLGQIKSDLAERRASGRGR